MDVYLATVPALVLLVVAAYYRWAAGSADDLCKKERVRADTATDALAKADLALQAARDQNVTLATSADRALGEAEKWRRLAAARMDGEELTRLADETFKP